MAVKKQTDAPVTGSEDGGPVQAKPKRPSHLSELCSQCGQYEVHPDYAAWSCEHGTWNLADDFDNGQAEPAPEPVSEEEVRASLLAELDVETLTALLAEKTAAQAPGK